MYKSVVLQETMQLSPSYKHLASRTANIHKCHGVWNTDLPIIDCPCIAAATNAVSPEVRVLLFSSCVNSNCHSQNSVLRSWTTGEYGSGGSAMAGVICCCRVRCQMLAVRHSPRPSVRRSASWPARYPVRCYKQPLTVSFKHTVPPTVPPTVLWQFQVWFHATLYKEFPRRSARNCSRSSLRCFTPHFVDHFARRSTRCFARNSACRAAHYFTCYYVC